MFELVEQILIHQLAGHILVVLFLVVVFMILVVFGVAVLRDHAVGVIIPSISCVNIQLAPCSVHSIGHATDRLVQIVPLFLLLRIDVRPVVLLVSIPRLNN